MESILTILTNNLVGLVGVLIVAIIFTQKMDAKLEKISERMSIDALANERIEFISRNYAKIEKLLSSFETIDAKKKIIDRINYELDEIGAKLDANFTNGSSIEKAFEDLHDFSFRLHEFIRSKSTDINGSERYIWLVDVVEEEISGLIHSLGHLVERDKKYKLMNPYLDSLVNLVSYFVTAYSSIEKISDEEDFKNLLRKRFEEDGSRRRYIFRPRQNHTI